MSQVEVDGVGIEYQVTGQGRPVVLLHGFRTPGGCGGHQVPVRDMPEVSCTELEFDTATQAGLDRLVFLLDTDAENVGIPPSKLIGHGFGVRQNAIDPVARVAIARPGALNAAVKAAAELAALSPSAGAMPRA